MHPIKFVANYTGLSQHTIRAWERRYSALSPERTSTNRRLYSEHDLKKLFLLQQAVQAGHSIGQIASLPLLELECLVAIRKSLQPGPSGATPVSAAATQQGVPYLDECLSAVERLDAQGLEDTLARAAALLGSAALIDRVLQPLLYSIGERWREGEVRPAHEHMASAIVRTFLGRMLDAFQPDAPAPRLVVTTPVGQIHELGALVAAVTAASEGWRVLYLGPNLPAEEIAGAAHQASARAVVLSIVYPPDDPRMDQEMVALRKFLGQEMPIIVGGRSATAYKAVLESIRAVSITDAHIFRTELEALRSPEVTTQVVLVSDNFSGLSSY